MSDTLTREQRRSLRRLEQRLADLTAGIDRHELRAAQLKEILARLGGERERLLASFAAASPKEPLPAVEPGEAVPGSDSSAERPERRGGPPPEAACVACESGEPAETGVTAETAAVFAPSVIADRFRQYQQAQRTRRTPQVVYPSSSAGESEPFAESVELQPV